jgi:hypothetical protein
MKVLRADLHGWLAHIALALGCESQNIVENFRLCTNNEWGEHACKGREYTCTKVGVSMHLEVDEC